MQTVQLNQNYRREKQQLDQKPSSSKQLFELFSKKNYWGRGHLIGASEDYPIFRLLTSRFQKICCILMSQRATYYFNLSDIRENICIENICIQIFHF